MGILFSRSSLSLRQGLTWGANPYQLRAMLRLETARIFSTKNAARNLGGISLRQGLTWGGKSSSIEGHAEA